MLGLLKAIVNFFCGSQSQKPGQQQHQLQQHQHQQQQHQQQPHQHQQHQQQQQPHRPHQSHQDPNQANQHNEHYLSLRAKANEHGDQMAKCFHESHEAYSRGDGGLAKDFSNQGKSHQKQMEELNKQASDWIFRENNKDSAPDEIDLHGLYVKEAILRADNAINFAKAQGRTELKLIVGKGLHSQGGVAKIKPAIENLMHKHNLQAQMDPKNAGVLIVEIEASGRGMGADEISRRLERQDEACIVM